VHLRALRPAAPGAPARPRPQHSLAETRDDWMKGWDEQEHTGRPASGPGGPTARVLPLAGLDAALPAGTARVTPAQRRHILDERLRQVTRLQRG
jgi:hypothetical protein